MEKNCAFQYAKMSSGMFRNTIIKCDETGLTLDEAKELWDKYYFDAARWMQSGDEVEMVIWINMENKNDYKESLYYISTDAESDGINIWVTKKEYFPKNILSLSETTNQQQVR